MFKGFNAQGMLLKGVQGNKTERAEGYAVGTNNLIETNILSKKFKGANYSQPMMFNQQYAVGGQVEENHDIPARRTIDQINSLDFSNYLGKN
jgi:hypothetical protein